tara:strand:+ start:8565 stop:9125 length:561 start_codon:yes stop_codon:yes gene_type:complete
MAEAKKLNEVYNFNKKPVGEATVFCGDGICSLDTDQEIMGIELIFKGNAEITPELPKGWIMQSNANKMIMFTLQNVPIQKTQLFSYIGSVEITHIIIANKDAKKVVCNLTKIKPIWFAQSSALDIETNTWDDMKDKRKKGIVKTTSYNLPDYGLPKVDKTKIKTKRRTSTSSYTTGGGSSGGSGGY